ncbi:AMP-binding protein [Akkermansiaceae bacterium]|nr:AMP-binding protein [Akkermansiaceae bacterium]
MKSDLVDVLDSSFWTETRPVVMGGDVELEGWLGNQEAFQKQVVFRTSGSSGSEKWISLSKEALEWSARKVIEHLKITEGDVLGLALPSRHVGGFGVVARAYFSGARLIEFERSWSPEEFSKWCELEGVTVTSLVPTQVSDLVRLKMRSPKSMRVIVVGGGHFEDGLKEQARELGWPVQPSYGMTETSSQIATGDGLPLIRGWEARIDEGHLLVKGEGLLSWIIRRTDSGFAHVDPKREGWYCTQDLAEIDRGKLRILGRADRQVKILGELVNLESLEKRWSEILECPTAVLTRPDVRRGVSLWLLVEGKAQSLDSLNQGMPGLERLAGWGFLKKFPRSGVGKIDRLTLKKIHAEYDCAKGETGLS